MSAFKKIKRITFKLLLLLVFLLMLSYWYLVHHAESLFSNFVKYETKGSIELDIKKLRFDYRALRLTLIDTRMFSTDTVKAFSSYDMQADTIVLELASLQPLLYGNHLKVDSIIIKRPAINVTKRKRQQDDAFSLPQQMNLAYNSLNKALDRFSVRYCLVDSGKFKLSDHTRPGKPTLSVTDYYLMIDHWQKRNFNGDRFMNADKVKLYSSNQHLTSLDGKHQLHYGRLRINSFKRIIELDSCYIFSQQSPGHFNKFSGFFDTLRFVNVDFIMMAEQNTLKADSVYCINPKVDISTVIRDNVNRKGNLKLLKNKDSLVTAVKHLMGNFRLKYIGVDNGSIKVVTKKADKISSYSLQKSDFAFQDVVVIDRPEIPLQIGRFDLGLMGYQAIDPDSSFVVRFDSVRLLNDHVYLSNFSAQPYRGNSVGGGIKKLKANALVVNDVQWEELFASRKIVASSVELNKPTVELETEKEKSRSKEKKDFFRVFHAIAPFADIQTLSVNDATIDISHLDKKMIHFEGLFASLKVKGFLQSGSFEELGKSIKDLSFNRASLRLNDGSLLLNNGYVRGADKMLWLKRLNLEKADGNLSFTFDNLSVNDLQSFSNGKIIADALHWEKAEVTALDLKKKKNDDSIASPIEIQINNISGEDISLNIDNNSEHIKSAIASVRLTDFYWNNIQSPRFTDVSVKGDFIRYQKNDFAFTSGKFHVGTKLPSFLNQAQLNFSSNRGRGTIEMPIVQFTPYIDRFQPLSLVVNDWVVAEPVISWKPNKLSNTKPPPIANQHFPSLLVNRFSLINPVVKLNDFDDRYKLQLNKLQMMLNIKEIRSIPNEGIYSDHIHCSIKNIGYQDSNRMIQLEDSGNVQLYVSMLNFLNTPQKDKPTLNATIDSISIAGLRMTDTDRSGESTTIQLHALQLKELHLNDLLHLSKDHFFEKNDFKIDKGTLSFMNAKNYFYLKNLRTENDNWMRFDSLAFHPSIPLETHLKKYDYQVDYLEFNAGSTRIGGLNKQRLLQHHQLTIDTIVMQNAQLQNFKDKRLRLLKGIDKMLPVGLIQKISFPFAVNHLSLQNAAIEYKELNDKNNRIGVVDFYSMQIGISAIKNSGLLDGDSLRIQAVGLLMGKAPVRFRYAQSYTDHWSGFSLGIRFRPFDLRELNKVLEPLAGASVLSGSLDTIRLNAIGTDSISHGKMRMYYKGLKIRYTGLGLDSSRNFKSRLISFLANDFILKRNNSKGYGIVYTPRDKERSFANYWMKIGLSGVMSSSGVKSNKKQEKRYRKQVEKMKIPELPEISL